MTTRPERGLRPERVAEIIVRLPPGEGKGRRGSGYLVASGTVLTAAHVVVGAGGIRVRFQADRPGERVVEATVAWADDGIDVAVLTLPDHTDDDVPPVSLGSVGDQDAVLSCTAMGFPRFKLRTNAAGGRFRDAEHMDARCAVLGNRREGTLDLRVTAPPAEDPDPERDAWEGMSGAAVFSGGYLVGVVSRHHRNDGLGRIAAGRVDRWAEALDDARQAALERLLGGGRGVRWSALPSAAPPTGVTLLQEAYRAQLADVAPERLEEREEVLAELVSFCAGPDPYLWLQGRPWAGKTALVAWFAQHPPRSVVPVWFFVTGRQAGQADSEAYSSALIDQLAAVAGSEPAVGASPTVRDGERRRLLREAAERVAQDGGILLLVVDGLDEDQFLQSRGGSGTSIASLLPERSPPNVRVLVTSRPSPDLPAQVRGDHLLRSCRVVDLPATAASRHTEYEAKYELQRALSDDRVQRDLVGFLAAARGTLAIDDLRGLTGESAFDLRQRLGGSFGRIVRLRGDVGSGGASGPEGYGGYTTDVNLYASTRGYLFAHDTLLTAAREELGQDLDTHVERLHGWAQAYQRRGWPQDTPLYLLQPYGHLLVELRDVSRATALATDVRRRDRLREVTGSDAACLAEMAAARQLVLDAAPDDLGSTAALAVVADLVARRNRSLHPDIPAVYARLGRVRQAIGLARSVFESSERVRAVGEVACVLAGQGDRRAVGLAEEAVRLTRPYADGAARGRLMAVLAVTGREEEAQQHLGDSLERARERRTVRPAGHCLATARALRGSERSVEWLRRAEEYAQDWYGPDRVRVLASIAEEWGAGGDTGNAERVYDEVVAFAQHARAQDDTLAVAADLLREVRPREAQDMAQRAEALRKSLKIPSLYQEEDIYRLQIVAQAAFGLVVADQLVKARELLEWTASGYIGTWGAPLWVPWAAIAERSARAGLAADAWDCIRAACATGRRPEGDGRPVADTARLVAEAGAADQLEPLLLTSTDVPRWAVAEALTALAHHFVGRDDDRALRLLHRAEHGPGPTDGFVPPHQARHLPALAGALAVAGLPEKAERLVETIEEDTQRALGRALVARAVSAVDRTTAVRLAVQAIDEILEPTRDLEPPRQIAGGRALMTAVQALAGAGAAEEVLRTLDQRLNGREGEVYDFLDDTARLAAAEGLWPHDPDTAGRLVDATLTGPGGQVVSGLAHVLAAVGPHDEERAARLRARLREKDARPWAQTFESEVLMSLITAAEDLVAARERFGRAVATYDETAEAIVHAALGDHETALAVARGARTNEERVRGARTKEQRFEDCAELAAYAAGVLSAVDGEAVGRRYLSLRPTIRHIVVSLVPPPDPDLPRARALLVETFTPEGWPYALPVLACIDPDAVRHVWDVVLPHLGLSD
ncbi:trypsin-like peptidase domain-containing protein [Streptomyces sp. NPDC002143]